jgi:putative CocE/NonD family hydrolase
MDGIVAGEPISWVAPWMDAQLRSDPYWQTQQVLDFAAVAQKIDIPVLMIGGWSDAFLSTQLDTWQQLATKNGSTLVIGPWDHLGRAAGDLDLDNVSDAVGLQDTYFQISRILDWLNHHLKAVPAQHPVGQALTYVVNDNRWAVRPAWPPETTPLTFSLSDGPAGQCAAALVASPVAAQVEATVHYTYDPADPTPSVGGAGSLAAVLTTYHGIQAGFANQRDLCEDRSDMVGWLSAPLATPLHIAGSISARLQVASSAPDTAFNVRVLDVRPDGQVIHVREGIRALTLRDGDRHRVPYTPGEPVRLPLETWPIEYVFQAGSRVMVQVASASFPKFEAHSNTTTYWADAVETVPAQQSVFTGLSQITLPVVRQPETQAASVREH